MLSRPSGNPPAYMASKEEEKRLGKERKGEVDGDEEVQEKRQQKE